MALKFMQRATETQRQRAMEAQDCWPSLRAIKMVKIVTLGAHRVQKW